jgi:hypothetical protein
MQNIDDVSKVIKLFKILGWKILILSPSLSNVHHLTFSKFERFLILIIKRVKVDEIEQIHFYNTHLNAFGSYMLLALKIMNFENVFSTKVIHFM